MTYPKTEEEWGAKAAAHLKAEMKKAGVTYTEMIKRLKKHGFKENPKDVLTTKLKRGAFAAFFLPSLSSSARA